MTPMTPEIWSCEKNPTHLFVRLKDEGCPDCKLLQLETMNINLLEALQRILDYPSGQIYGERSMKHIAKKAIGNNKKLHQLLRN